NVAAGAGFREDEGLLAFGQEADNGGVELVVLIAENMRAELAADDGFGFGDEFAGGVAAGHETDVHLAVMSAIAEFQPRAGERFEEGGDFFFDDGFAHAGGAQSAANERGIPRDVLPE